MGYPAANYLTGLTGSVMIGVTNYRFGKWGLPMTANVMPVNNFGSGGFQEVVPGVKSAELTLEALTYDAGNMPFAIGTSYTFILNYNATYSITITIMIETIDPEIDYDGLQPIKISGKSNGAFVAAIS